MSGLVKKCFAAGVLFLAALWLYNTFYASNLYRKKGLVLAFGTVNEVTLYGEDRDKLDEAFTALEAFFSNKHDVWHAWKPSLLTDFNDKLSSGNPFMVNSPEFLELIKATQDLANSTEHHFNPALGHVFNLWNFQETTKDPQPPEAVYLEPFQTDIPSMADIHWLDENLAIGYNPLVEVDLGGIAKGFSVEKAIEYLRALGIENALVNAGGDLKLIGQANHRPWKVAIRDPWKEQYAIAYLDLEGPASVFSSGTYERHFEHQGKIYHHIIDPKTMHPTSHGIKSVTIIHDNATEADAYATALIAAGPKSIKLLAKKLGIEEILVIFDDRTVWISKAMQEHLHWLADIHKLEVIS